MIINFIKEFILTLCKKYNFAKDGIFYHCMCAVAETQKSEDVLTAHENWISVDDALPPFGKEVIVNLGGNGTMSSARYNDTDVNHDKNKFSHSGYGGDVKFWMPMPPPPADGNIVNWKNLTDVQKESMKISTITL